MKYKIQAIVLVMIAFILGYSEFIIIGIVSTLATAFSVSPAQVGLLVTAFALVYAICTPFINLWIGKRRLHLVLLLLMGIFVGGNLATALATSFMTLAIARIVTATVSGAIISVAITFGAAVAPRAKRARLIAWIFSGFSIASVFGVPLGTWMSGHLGWRSVFIVITLLALITTGLMYWLMPHNISQGQAKSLRDQLGILKNRQIQIGLALPMLNLAGIYAFYTYLSPIITKQLGLPLAWLTPLLFLYGLMSLFSNLGSGRLAEQSGLRRLPWVFMIQCLLLLTQPLLAHWPIAGVLNMLVLGLSMYLINAPIQMHFMGIAERDYPQSMVLASSFNSIFSNVGIALGSGVGSVSFNQFGLNFIGPVGALFAFGALLAVHKLNQLIAKQ
ncbi:major facilitator superfamily protein [Agrilactobacillus composti DSM 18527 = JCM 14202]|uniref:Major facilitator superfamily protein n=2 Tax=Agrilactobacillus TaxID=2767875 RepID=A0A0R1XKQ1_9LACO|nr:MFS transporter [Agrilactobacillus composti]KRM30784.1 major facilitator superfamily protein [Agrilactobacillus composti DSM 18527 = JCM 14202]